MHNTEVKQITLTSKKSPLHFLKELLWSALEFKIISPSFLERGKLYIIAPSSFEEGVGGGLMIILNKKALWKNPQSFLILNSRY